LTSNVTFTILHSYLSQCTCKTIKIFSTTASSFITKKAFQNHAQAALDISAIDQSADLCLVSALICRTLDLKQSCRLVPLKKKDNCIRPIGVGECLRRIIGKTITGLLKEDIIRAVGTLQTCARLESGIEAATHAVRESYEEEGSEFLLLADADNAFNKLNRKVSPENIKRLCPPMYTYLYLHNSYNTPTMVYLENGDHILSQKGVTQRDNAAMAMYTLST